MFSTGLGYVIKGNYWLMAFDRGSTGSKGLHVHCGVCDKDYRGEVFICIKNDNPYAVKFSSVETPGFRKHKDSITVEEIIAGSNAHVLKMKEVEVIDYLVYPTSKGIAQLIPVEMPEISVMPCGELE